MQAHNFNNARAGEFFSCGSFRADMPREVKEQNDLLRQALGTLGSFPAAVYPGSGSEPEFKVLPGNETPHYQWMWSENLVRLKRDKVPGRKTFDLSSFSFPEDEGKLIVIPERDVFKARGTQIHNSWVIAHAQIAQEEALWYSRAGEDIAWPGVIWLDTVGTPLGPLRVLTQYKQPWLSLTQEIIGLLLENRKQFQRPTEELGRISKELDRKSAQETDKDQMEIAMGIIDEMAPVRDHVPGKLGSGGVWHRAGGNEGALVTNAN